MRYSAYVSPFCSLIVNSNAFNEAATMSPVKMMPRTPMPIAISFDSPDSGVKSPYPIVSALGYQPPALGKIIPKQHHGLATLTSTLM